jgi:tetratricopeptide (TPR) repeat protein
MSSELVKRLREEVEARPRDFGSRMRLGKALLSDGEFEAAQDEFQKAVEINPDEPLAVAGVAKAVLMQGAYKDALDLYVVALNEGLQETPDVLVDLGVCTSLDGDYQSARKFFEAAIGMDLDCEDAYAPLVTACLATRDLEAAERYASLGVERFPGSEECRVARASVLVLLARGDEARAEFAAVLERNPFNVEALVGQANLLIAEGRAAEAGGPLERARELAPDNADVLLSLGSWSLALDRLDEADKYFRRAMKVDPLDPRLLTGAASLALRRGDVEQGLEYAGLGLQVAPEAHMFHYLKGALFYKGGRLDEAAAELEASVKANPYHLLSYIALAEVYAQLPGRRNESRANAQRALELSPQGPVAERARLLLGVPN